MIKVMQLLAIVKIRWIIYSLLLRIYSKLSTKNWKFSKTCIYCKNKKIFFKITKYLNDKIIIKIIKIINFYNKNYYIVNIFKAKFFKKTALKINNNYCSQIIS